MEHSLRWKARIPDEGDTQDERCSWRSNSLHGIVLDVVYYLLLPHPRIEFITSFIRLLVVVWWCFAGTLFYEYCWSFTRIHQKPDELRVNRLDLRGIVTARNRSGWSLPRDPSIVLGKAETVNENKNADGLPLVDGFNFA
mmetsp:Transcript_21879/g.60840  ORF Transcript_21879/g.60840 Transcript_21879/m.60840 type:complete len:140 (-) Transcript_21879:4074-4493(-)